MDRDLGKPKKSEAGAGLFAGLTQMPSGFVMKQIPNACICRRVLG
jgi:hypothetical protein